MPEATLESQQNKSKPDTHVPKPEKLQIKDESKLFPRVLVPPGTDMDNIFLGKTRKTLTKLAGMRRSENEVTVNSIHEESISVDGSKVRVRYQYIMPSEGREEEQDKTIIYLPGYSIGADTKTSKSIAQAFANKKNAPVFVVDTSLASAEVQNSLTAEAHAIAQLIEKEGLNNITIVGHSDGGRQAINLASVLQKLEAINIDGLILLDSIGLYEQQPWKKLALGFAGDSIKTGTQVMKQLISGKSLGHGRNGKTSLKNTYQFLKDAASGISKNVKEAGIRYPQTLRRQVKEMAALDKDQKERMASLTVPVIIVNGEKDAISHPNILVPQYSAHPGLELDKTTDEYFDPRERYLRSTLFKNSPYIRMVTAKHMGHHGLPIFRPESVANASLALLDRAKQI